MHVPNQRWVIFEAVICDAATRTIDFRIKNHYITFGVAIWFNYKHT